MDVCLKLFRVVFCVQETRTSEDTVISDSIDSNEELEEVEVNTSVPVSVTNNDVSRL